MDDPIGAAILFAIGLVIFVGVAIGIRHLILTKKVPPLRLIYRENTGEFFRAGETYIPADSDFAIPMAPRRISATHAAGKHGLAVERYFNASYVPDEANIHAYMQSRQQRYKLSEFEDALALQCGEKLCIDPRPNCADVAESFGVKFTSFDYPDQAERQPKDSRIEIERYLANDREAAGAKLEGMGDAATQIAQAKDGSHPIYVKYPHLNTPEGRLEVVDVLRQMFERAKKAQ